MKENITAQNKHAVTKRNFALPVQTKKAEALKTRGKIDFSFLQIFNSLSLFILR
jgi:hypothetical protein